MTIPTAQQIEDEDYCTADLAELRRAYDDAQGDIHRLLDYITSLQNRSGME